MFFRLTDPRGFDSVRRDLEYSFQAVCILRCQVQSSARGILGRLRVRRSYKPAFEFFGGTVSSRFAVIFDIEIISWWCNVSFWRN